MKKVFFYSGFLLILMAGSLVSQNAEAAAPMQNYCVAPPFVVGGVKPNLLMMIDNSSSMYDLQYVDQGKFTGACSVTTSRTCSDTVSCPSGEYCNNKTFARSPYYCYDETYNSRNTYVGYFPNYACSSSGRACATSSDCSGGETCMGPLYYQYDFTNSVFNQVAALPTGCSAGAAYSLTGNLLVCVSGATVSTFAASGNYLNWLAASKFDVEKQILTGGKYVSKVCSVSTDTACTAASDCPLSSDTCVADPRNISFLQGESRGCVGRKYIKEPLTSNFVNYASPESNNTNTSLGITFGIKGPVDSRNATALSPGGQTYIDVFLGDYNQGNCQAAIDLLVDPTSTKQAIVTAIDVCLNNTATNKKTCQYDQNTTCISDTDCIIAAGTCNVQNNGVCSLTTAGTCGVTTAGVCTANNGLCQGSGNNKKCVGGGKAGASCKKDGDCAFSSCTIGNVGALCSVNSDCNVKSCTAGKVGSSCVVNTDCDAKNCTAPAGKVGNACTLSTDCNDNACAAGSPANAGLFCITNWDCSSTKGHCLAPATTQTKSTFAQSMNSCYQYTRRGQDVGSNEVEQVSNPAGCNQIYAQYKTCTGGAHDGAVCGSDADCGGGRCSNGPSSIQPGSPVLLCSSAYCGYCASNPNNDNWQTTSWVAREYPSADECIKAKYREYCKSADIPPVVDPTDSPSQTDQYANLPAIIGDMGIESQLGNPIATLKAQNYVATAPTGLLQDFTDLIRFGAMSFNTNGSPTECTETVPLPAGAVPCPKKCSVSTSIACSSYLDCPSGETCDLTVRNVDNLDGAKMLAYIGDPGACSVSSNQCSSNAECLLANEKCISVGNHNYGLINAVDKIKASTWTPFGEAFYNAIGYFARTNAYDVAPALSRTDLRLNTIDFDEKKNPSQYECQGNNILLVTDGMSTTDRNDTVTTMAGVYNGASPAPPTPGKSNCPAAGLCSPYAGSTNIEQLAWIAKNRDIKNLTKDSAYPAPTGSLLKSQYITSYVVFEGGSNGQAGDCNSETLMSNTATYGGTALKRAEDPGSLRDQLKKAFLEISSGASSGTAASVLASGEGSGATLIQALFYPTRTFSGSELHWTGSLQNYWYYLDPFLQKSTIREDTATPNILDISTDNVMHFFFDADNQTKANLFDSAGNYVSTKYLDETMDPANKIKYLWEAGDQLLSTRPDDRVIYTTKDGTNRIIFDTTKANDLRGLLQAADDSEANRLISYTRGYDMFCSVHTTQPCGMTGLALCPGTETCQQTFRTRTVTTSTTNTWKLGDIVTSTPKVSSWMPLNVYNKVYADSTYGPVGEDVNYTDPVDPTHFITSSMYKNRGVVFVGSNDGMLHAFKLGTIKLLDTEFQKAQLLGSGLGQELWSYIPKHALPYLRYIADPGYCHVYTVDAIPAIFDVSIGPPGSGDPTSAKCTTDPCVFSSAATSNWRTILIGGMRLGGACSNTATAFNVQTPANDIGYSSYFALDITDPMDPQILWEFSNENIKSAFGASELNTGGLGFSTTGPALMRIAAKAADGVTPDNSKDGRWFVVFGSGPTGPIDTISNQFKGYSDQNLKLFIVDLKNGPTSGNIWKLDTGIKNAFAGSLLGSPIDLEQNDSTKRGFYQDEALYFGYTTAETDPPDINTKWTKGGILRLVTGDSLDPGNWTFSKVIDDIGPVTGGVAKLQNYKPGSEALWLFFGTGRYYYKVADQIDDATSVRRLYGIKEPCFSGSGIDTACSAHVTAGSLVSGSVCNATYSGLGSAGNWCIDLDSCTNSSGTVVSCNDVSVVYKAERVVTDPVGTSVGAVLFATSKPTADPCKFGGISHLWAVQYDTGGSVKKGMLKGTALVQVSTGSIEEKKLNETFTEKPDSDTGEGRRGPAMQGYTLDKPQVPEPPKPVNRFLHIRER